MACVAESPIQISAEPIEGIEIILDSESVSMSSEVSSGEPDPQLQPGDMDISPTKEETDESMSSSDVNIDNSTPLLQKTVEPPTQSAPTSTGADVTVLEAPQKSIDAGDTSIAAGDIRLKTGAIEEKSKDTGVGTVQTAPDPKTVPEAEDDEVILESVVPKKETEEKDDKKESKVNIPSVTLVLESAKLEDVENNINKVIHKARSNEQVSAEAKAELVEQIRTLKKSDLETLITDKIIEAIAIHSNVGALSQKLIQSNTQRDRLFHKISNLQRQVTELSKAVRSVSENVGRNQKPVNKANQPIRFYRSVGVQVVLEGAVANPPRKPVSVLGDVAKSILKSGNSNAQQTPVNSVLTARPLKPLINTLTPLPQPSQTVGLQIGNVNPNLKRPLKPTITVADVTKLADIQNKIRRVSTSPASSQAVATSAGLLNGGAKITIAPTPARQPPALHQIRNPAAAAASKVLNAMGPKSVDLSVVDLTDDDAPSRAAATTAIVSASNNAPNLVVSGSPNNVVLAQNGVQQYRLISPGQQFQFIQAGKSYQIVTSGAQTRPMYVSPANLQPAIRPGQQIRPVTTTPNQLVLRGMPNMIPTQTTSTPISINGGQLLMRPVAPRPPTNTVSPMMARPPYSIVSTRPGITVTTANPSNNKVTFSNGIGTNRITTAQTFRQAAPQVGRAGGRPSIESPVKKFILPPLPPPAITGNPRRCSKDIPPRPELTLVEQNEGIVLSWTLKLGPNHAEIQTYQIYACQEPLFNSQKSAAWKRVGDVKALPLPMACTLSQFTDENRYHFIVRGVDVYNRTGPFCEASSIKLMKKS